MTAEAQRLPYRRIERAALALGALALPAGALLATGQPRWLATAWLYAVFAVLQPALGSLILLLLYRMTGGQWAQALRPWLHAGTALLPWIWLLLLPLTLLPTHHASAEPGGREMTGLLAAYTSRGMSFARYLVIGGVLTALGWGARRAGTDLRLRWVGPVGFIVLAFSLHLAASDWLFALEPGWYSTGFPLIWMAGHTVSGLAAAVAFAIWTGRQPAALGTSRRPEGIDWGNLLLAVVLFWSYLAFMHLLIMWMGNLAHEIGWYADRATPGWAALIAIIAVFHLFLPLLLLFFRGFKRSARGLGTLAAALVVFQALHTAWLIFPSFKADAVALVPAALLAVATLGVFFNRYAHLAARLEAAT